MEIFHNIYRAENDSVKMLLNLLKKDEWKGRHVKMFAFRTLVTSMSDASINNKETWQFNYVH